MRTLRHISLLVVLDADVLPSGLAGALESEGLLPTLCAPDKVAAAIADRPAGAFDALLAIAPAPAPWSEGLARMLQAAADETPTVLLYDSVTQAERVRCLRAGADDVQGAAGDFEEVVLRLLAIVRRCRAMPTLSFHDLSIDLGRREVRLAGSRVDVSPKEFDLLRVLTEARGDVCSRAELLQAVWGRDKDPGTAVVEVLVARLRRKLERGERTLIRTRHRRGYQLVGPTEVMAE